ncbi:hypothetical protein [Pectobacterium carotovorum]|uniref:Phage protein n=1 Tax=Pectobacterium carotovorum subsp. carotovorum TaxID=555 RepID=A0AAI9PF11_PECCC|nr:hypothetical protein [Pectobacterium carotovorum]GKX48002.1 hypothetical protein SOASR016_27540 [Pectobacterium carotovorum subsp. carotovorum]GLV70446.1 hypothetical protein Pcaca03_28900 [Pectobacterium carotovorum subsp. carotovorum]
MTTLSTTQLIEAMRTAAVAADTEQGREKLNAIANRMEMLVAANADMDLQLNSIRSALNIPDAQSVKSGVVDAFVRLNAEILELRNQLAELREQEPDLYLCPVTRSGEKLFSPCGRDYPRGRGYYTRAAPPVASHLESDVSAVVGLLEEHEWAEHCTKTELGKRLEHAITQLHNERGEANQPYTVPDERQSTLLFDEWFKAIEAGDDENWQEPKYLSKEWSDYLSRMQLARGAWEGCRAAMLQLSSNSPQWIGVDWARGCEPVSSAIKDVIAERQRQISAEGWTHEHDDRYEYCEMAVAAACYIMADDDPRADIPELWPWEPEWWKPTNIRRDLVKAGALVIAEIERLDRVEAKDGDA